jgi:hypothetical protein
MHTWTLVSLDRIALAEERGRLSIDYAAAMMANEMALVGDQLIGTAPPIRLRLVPREHGYRPPPSGSVQITIDKTEIISAGTLVEDARERRIAWQLIMFGGWPIGEPTAIVDENGFLSAIEYTVEPDSDTIVPAQGFQFVGSLSEIITRMYLLTTGVDAAGPARLRPAGIGPDRLAVEIPNDYQGQALKLWRFTVVAPRSSASST